MFEPNGALPEKQNVALELPKLKTSDKISDLFKLSAYEAVNQYRLISRLSKG